MRETEVLIVGGGPAGAILSKELANAGVKNILIQRNFGFKKPCGGGIGLDAFEEFGVDTSLIRDKVTTLAIVHKKHSVEIDISSTPIAIVERVAFDTALRLDAKEAGSEVLEAAFVTFFKDEEFFISKIKVGEKYEFIRSKTIVGADGVHSKLRKQVMAPPLQSILSSYCDIAQKSYKRCEFHFGKDIAPGHYAWAFPHATGGNIGTISEQKSCFLHFKKQLDITEETKELGYPIPLYEEPLFFRDGVYFVGDAASQVLPFTYEGIYYAMSAAKILSSVLIENADPQEYEARWSKRHKRHFETLKKVQKIFLHNDFMITLMLRLYESKTIQREMVRLWLGERELTLDGKFFLKLFVKLWRR